MLIATISSPSTVIIVVSVAFAATCCSRASYITIVTTWWPRAASVSSIRVVVRSIRAWSAERGCDPIAVDRVGRAEHLTAASPRGTNTTPPLSAWLPEMPITRKCRRAAARCRRGCGRRRPCRWPLASVRPSTATREPALASASLYQRPRTMCVFISGRAGRPHAGASLAFDAHGVLGPGLRLAHAVGGGDRAAARRRRTACWPRSGPRRRSGCRRTSHAWSWRRRTPSESSASSVATASAICSDGGDGAALAAGDATQADLRAARQEARAPQQRRRGDPGRRPRSRSPAAPR